MSFVLIGVNHRSSPLEIRERLVFPADAMGEALRALIRLPEIDEGMLLSTCNRTEVIALARSDHDRVIRALKAFLARERSFDPEELDAVVYIKVGSEVVRHVFRLGVGLDSMILGEPQILGQVKDAYGEASKHGVLGSQMRGLLERSFAVAKKVRTSTAIGRSPVSVSYAAVELAHKIFGDLSERSVLILGAGETAELAVRHLRANGIRSIYVVNRTFSRAEALAREFQGEAAPYDCFLECLEKVDILISSTSAPEHVLSFDDATKVIRLRRSRPLFLIDIAVPRDVDPAVNQIDNMYLYDIDDLRRVADAGLEERRLAAQHAERLIDREVIAYGKWARAEEIAPTIVELRDKLHRMREAELGRFESRLRGLEPDQRRFIAELTSSLINKVLHDPIRHLKHSAASPNGADRIAWVRELFGLSETSLDGDRATKEGIGEEEKAAEPANRRDEVR